MFFRHKTILNIKILFILVFPSCAEIPRSDAILVGTEASHEYGPEKISPYRYARIHEVSSQPCPPNTEKEKCVDRKATLAIQRDMKSKGFFILDMDFLGSDRKTIDVFCNSNNEESWFRGYYQIACIFSSKNNGVIYRNKGQCEYATLHNDEHQRTQCIVAAIREIGKNFKNRQPDRKIWVTVNGLSSIRMGVAFDKEAAILNARDNWASEIRRHTSMDIKINETTFIYSSENAQKGIISKSISESYAPYSEYNVTERDMGYQKDGRYMFIKEGYIVIDPN